PPVEKDPITQEAELSTSFNNKVDILWVMDTSDSMYCDQQKVSREIKNFSDVFLSKQGQFLDFHIGVTATWDSVTYGNAERDCQLGELRPVGGPLLLADGINRDEGCSRNATTGNYVTRETPDLAAVLAKTLNIGTQKYDSSQPTISGPNKE